MLEHTALAGSLFSRAVDPLHALAAEKMRPEEQDAFWLPGRWRDRAREELGEELALARSNVEALRKLVLSEKNLFPRTDDTFLLAFLRAKKHGLEDAFKMLKNYYRLKKLYPKHLEDSLPSEKPFAYDMAGFTVLAERDQHDRVVVGVRVEDVDLQRVCQEHFFQLLVSLLQAQVEDPLVQVAGVVVLVDMTGFTLRKAAIVTPTFARLSMRIMQDSFPMRLKAIHIVFEPFYFDAIFALFKPFLKEKMRRRIYLHGYDLPSLHAALPRSLLPPNLGGLAPDWNFHAFRRDMERREGHFREWRKYGYSNKPDGPA